MLEEELTESVRETIQSAAKKLTGFQRRAVSGGNSHTVLPERSAFGRTRLWLGTRRCQHRTERTPHWNFVVSRITRRVAVARAKWRTPIWCKRFTRRSNRKARRTRSFQTPLAYTRITAKAVHERLVANTADHQRHVPAERTVHDILNRLGYRLRRVQKTKPQKKSMQPMRFSTTCGRSACKPHKPRKRSVSRLIPRPK